MTKNRDTIRKHAFIEAVTLIESRYCRQLCAGCRRQEPGFWRTRHDNGAYVHRTSTGNEIPCDASQFRALIEDLENLS